MKTFIRKVIIYSIPVLLVYLFPFVVYILGKEYISLESIVLLQNSNPKVLYGFSYYGEPHVPYKMLLMDAIHPDVLILGTSRSFQIRKEFFTQPERFLNAAVPRPAIGNIGNMKVFLDALPQDGKKRTLFLVLDRRLFTEDYPDGFSLKEDSFITKFRKLSGKPLRLIYLDYFSGKYSLQDLVHASFNTDAIGLWALIADTGYRFDGTHKEGYYMERPDRKDLLAREIEGRVEQIKAYDPTLLAKEKALIPLNLEYLSELLALSKERNISVVGFVPPDPVDVSVELKNGTSPYAQLQNTLTKEIAAVFLDNEAKLFDLSDIRTFGGSDDEFLDLIHGGDLLYARLFLHMGLEDKSLRKYIDVAKLKEMTKNAKGDFLGF